MNYQAFAIVLSMISIVLAVIGVLPINTATMLFVLPIISAALYTSTSDKKQYKKNVAKHRKREEQ